MGNFYNMGWGFGFGGIFMLIFWGLLIWAIIALIRSGSEGGCCARHKNESNHSKNNALDILKERYAKGELSAEDFEKMRKNLE